MLSLLLILACFLPNAFFLFVFPTQERQKRDGIFHKDMLTFQEPLLLPDGSLTKEGRSESEEMFGMNFDPLLLLINPYEEPEEALRMDLEPLPLLLNPYEDVHKA
jgi:hypothetical protein